jgi:hypothetical protein
MSDQDDSAPRGRSLTGKAAGAIAHHPHIALAAIVVLTILVCSLFVFYRGVAGVGPYVAEASDSDTERLIATINGE